MKSDGTTLLIATFFACCGGDCWGILGFVGGAAIGAGIGFLEERRRFL